MFPYLKVVPASGVFSRLSRYLKPMITWNTTFFKEIERRYGACITVNSVEELENKIFAVFKSKKLREQLEKGTNKLLEERSWKNIAKEYIKVYESL